MSYVHCQVCPLVSHFQSVKAVDEAVNEDDLFQQAKSDNTDLARNFAKSIGTVALQDKCHGHCESLLHSSFAVLWLVFSFSHSVQRGDARQVFHKG